jgi:hypothetical protein
MICGRVIHSFLFDAIVWYTPYVILCYSMLHAATTQEIERKPERGPQATFMFVSHPTASFIFVSHPQQIANEVSSHQKQNKGISLRPPCPRTLSDRRHATTNGAYDVPDVLWHSDLVRWCMMRNINTRVLLLWSNGLSASGGKITRRHWKKWKNTRRNFSFFSMSFC